MRHTFNHPSFSWSKKCICFLIACAAWFCTSHALAKPNTSEADKHPAQSATKLAPPKLDNVAYLLMDFGTGQVLAEKNADAPLPPASLTKMMTSYILEQKLISGELNNEDMVPVSKYAACDPKKGESCMFLRAGRQASVIDLLRGIVIQSGNDASRAIAEHIGGTEEKFAAMMNKEAAQLGMKDTNFRNSTGMPKIGHESTARDLATLARAIISKNSIYYPIYAEKYFTYDKIKQYNRNKLLFTDKTVDGLKTGHTDAAGYCLITSSKRGNARLISVILGTKSKAARARQSKKLLDWGFDNFQIASIAPKSMFVAKAPVWYGTLREVNLITKTAVNAVLPKTTEQGKVSTRSEYAELEAPLTKGQQVGVFTAYLDGKKLTSTPIIVEKDVPQAGFFQRLWDGVRRFFSKRFS